MSIAQRLRHPDNTKLQFHYADTYQQREVYQHHSAPLITQHLARLDSVLSNATEHYTRVFAFRIDLRFPQGYPFAIENNALINAFLKRLQRSINSAGTKYSSQVRFVWAREQHQSEHPHYHVMLFLNYDAYNALGSFYPSASGGYDGKGLYHQMVRAWSHVLGIDSCFAQGLVHLPQDPYTGKHWTRCLHRYDAIGLQEAFYLGSYLCKSYTKPYGRGYHCFGSSRS